MSKPVPQDAFVHDGVEVRTAIDERDGGIATLDEIVASGKRFHLEFMDRGHIWMQVGNVRVNLWADSRGRIHGRAEKD